MDFARDVHPILVRRCVTCHGPDTQRAMLRLDARVPAFAGGRSGKVIVPGDPDASPLVQRLVDPDPRRRMPRKEAPLPAGEVAVLRAWIAAGAPWPAGVGPDVASAVHWAFRAPAPQSPPDVRDPWVRNPIDAFVLARLRAEGLPASPEADRRTLLRRVHLDLTGLLPSPEEVETFVADPDPDAYERVVDRLLASPHYGERMARAWLDLARYADSDGYSIDAPRVMWRWRDWVVRAFQEDLPFDRFTIEQIAGDLLPDAGDRTRIATGFHRNTMTNEEGGVDPEEFRVEAVKDRVNTTATVWLGITLACAQCHDHKYDPFSQREYYQLFAFFDDADEHDLLVDAAAVRDRKNRQQVAAASAPVLRQRAQPRDTRIQEAGDFTRPGAPVQPGVPAALHPLAPGAGRATRLDLARWLVAADNPLTARVQVNRLWLRLFGTGLVATDEDFGSQGEAASHPELLDWLARAFVADGWSHKRILRRIVTSATYRQASVARADLSARDPANRLLGRQTRLRLDAELVRDVALCASGLLSRGVGGPSVFPPQPEGVLAQGQVERKWVVSRGQDRYRRGLYTFRWRMTPHPALAVFDAPAGVETCTRRTRSNTPLQALTLLHDEALLECARALAARAVRDAGGGDAAIARLFLFAVQREPTPRERAVLWRLLVQTGGDWTAAARAVLNLDEAITRE
ncbi:MAG: PSD1 domain-containing protein [Planctomycetes bacterium]|nr:PSD1 domain-containing protein [Planctomycetota bacterium]